VDEVARAANAPRVSAKVAELFSKRMQVANEKFATDSALYLNMVRLTASLDSLVSDIKQHPGKIGVTVKMF